MNNAPNMMQIFQSFKANPMPFFMSRKFNIPQSMANDPNAILNHLLQTGQVSQQQVNTAYQMMQKFNTK